jgi:hypothetical protein
MAYLKQKADPRRYWVRDAKCLGAECFALGLYQHRAAAGASGTRNTGAISATCMTNACHGCPACPKYRQELARERRKDGLKVL